MKIFVGYWVDTDNLVTVGNFAKKIDMTSSYVYKLEKNRKISFVDLDGVKFVDIKKYKSFLLDKKRRSLKKSISKILKTTTK